MNPEGRPGESRETGWVKAKTHPGVNECSSAFWKARGQRAGSLGVTVETAFGVSRGSSSSFAIRAWLDLSPLGCHSEEVFVELGEAVAPRRAGSLTYAGHLL